MIEFSDTKGFKKSFQETFMSMILAVILIPQNSKRINVDYATEKAEIEFDDQKTNFNAISFWLGRE